MDGYPVIFIRFNLLDNGNVCICCKVFYVSFKNFSVNESEYDFFDISPLKIRQTLYTLILLPQQILGNWSPESISTIRVPPMDVFNNTVACGVACTVPMIRVSLPRG